MKCKQGFRFLAGPALVVAMALPFAGGCSAKDAAAAAQGCNGLDVSGQADLTVKAFADAAVALKTAAANVEAKWLATCNAINADLNLDTSKTDAAGACGVLNARIKSALAAGVTVSVSATYECTADAHVAASCQGECAAKAGCDIEASCTPAQLSGTCSAKCEGSCTGGSVDCSGECTGTCEATAAVSCSGTCEGTCSGNFSGSCEGNCSGQCDGQAASGTANGNCAGKCEGTCTGGNASGTCSGQCTGKCATEVAASCSGKCSGTCTVTPATCNGQCTGGCSVKYTEPHCEGDLSCNVDANCKASCDGQASASVNCGGQAKIEVTGDAELYAALQAHGPDIAAALNATIALKDPIIKLADQVGASIKAMADITAAGTTCMVASLQVMIQAKASINVSVQASASVNGSAG